MPVTTGRGRKSGLAKATVKVPRKRIPGQPGLEPIGAPLTARERRVANTFNEALTMPPSVIAEFNLTDDVSYLPGNGPQMGTDLYPSRADGKLTPILDYLEPAREELAEELLNQIDESGAVFWNELTDQLGRKPDPSAINRVEKAATPKPVTVIPPVGNSFSVGFSSRSPAGKQWAETKSARMITNIAEDTRANLQDIIGGTTGKGGRQAMMNMLGEVLETAPSLGDLAEFGERLAPSVAGLTLPQHNAVLNRARTVFGEAITAGKTTEQALEAVEREASKYGKKLRQHRTRVISRTEMMEASNQGKMVAARQAADAGMFNPQRAGRQWITATFDVCVICEPLHGKIVAFEGGAFNATYPKSGDWVVEPRDLPPAHPNCRCTWTLVYDTIVPPSTGMPGTVIAPQDIPAAVREQAWRSAAQVHKQAIRNQDFVTKAVTGVGDDLDVEMYGLAFNVKEEASLARKIATDFVEEGIQRPNQTVADVADKIGDSLRYTMVMDEGNYNDLVAAALRDFRERGYELTKAPKNYWRVPSDKNPYNGINVNLRAPNGQVIEVQFHTRASIEAKEKLHPIYEKTRQIGIDTIEEKRLLRAATDIANEVPHPTQVTDLEWFPEEANPYRMSTDDDLYNRFGGRLPGGTEDAYTINGEWWEGRLALHREITDDIIGDVPVAPPGEQVVHFMGGGPASGKGTALDRGLIDLDRDTMVVVDADEIKKGLPEYNVLSKESNTNAAAYVHEESSMLSKSVMAESVGSGRNTMLDGTGDSSMKKLRAKVTAARQSSSGDRVIADYVTVDIEEAVRRAASRGRRTGRYVPEKVVRETHQSISRIFPDILDEDIFNDIKLWDTNFDPPKLILRKKDGLLEIYDEDAYAKFLRKADYDVDPVADTFTRYTEDGKWIESRVEGVHRPYVEAELANGGFIENNEVVFMGGGPASGKSHAVKTGKVRLPERHVMVNADEAKDAIPEFGMIIEQRGEWSTNAAAYVHEESSYMAKQLMSEALDGSNNVVLDGTGDSSYMKLRAKVSEARESAGRVVAEYVTVDTELALARSADRGLRTGRYVPPKVLRETHEGVSAVFPRAATDDLFDEIRLWDTNSSGDPILVYEKIAGQPERILRPDLYENFLRKNPDYRRVDIPQSALPTEVVAPAAEEVASPIPGVLIPEDDLDLPEWVTPPDPTSTEIAAVADMWFDLTLDEQNYLLDHHLDQTIRRIIGADPDAARITRLTLPDLPPDASPLMVEARSRQLRINKMLQTYARERKYGGGAGDIVGINMILTDIGTDFMKVGNASGTKVLPILGRKLGPVDNLEQGLNGPATIVGWPRLMVRWKEMVDRGELYDEDALRALGARIEREMTALGGIAREEITALRTVLPETVDLPDQRFYRMAALGDEQLSEMSDVTLRTHDLVSDELGWDRQAQMFAYHEGAVGRALDTVSEAFAEEVFDSLGLDMPAHLYRVDKDFKTGVPGSPFGMYYKVIEEVVREFRAGQITEEAFTALFETLGEVGERVAREVRDDALAAAGKGVGSRSEKGKEIVERLFNEETGVLYTTTANGENIWKAAYDAAYTGHASYGKLRDVVAEAGIQTATAPSRARAVQRVLQDLRQYGDGVSVNEYVELAHGFTLPTSGGDITAAFTSETPAGIRLNKVLTQWLPADWLRRSNEMGRLGLGVRDGSRASYIGRAGVDIPYTVNSRIEAGDGIIDITRRGIQDPAGLHEFVHRDQFGSIIHYEMDQQFMRRRIEAAAEGDPAYTLRPLNEILPDANYGVEEMAIEDEFMTPYMGRIYDNMGGGPIEGGDALELSSVGIEELAFGKEYQHIIDVDPDMADYLLGLLLAG